MRGQVQTLGGFAPSDAFDQIREHFSFTRGEALERVLRTVLLAA
jgi:hypothetical protein